MEGGEEVLDGIGYGKTRMRTYGKASCKQNLSSSSKVQCGCDGGIKEGTCRIDT